MKNQANARRDLSESLGLEHSSSRSGARLVCLLLLWAMLGATARAGKGGGGVEVDIFESFGEHPISAMDEASLRKAVQHLLPGPGGDAEPEVRTSVELTGHLTLESRDGGCTWSGPKYRLHIHTTLPRWSERDQAEPKLQAAWDEALQGMSEHEEGHRLLARNSVAALLERVRELDVSHFQKQPCHKIRKQISAIETRERMQLAVQHINYDRRTELGAAQGAAPKTRGRPTCATLAFRTGECPSQCVCPADAGRQMRNP